MNADNSASLRQHIVKLLKGREAHADFEAAIADLPAELRGVKPPGAPYTIWQLLEHMRIAQWDILDFSRNPEYVEPKWPDDYWPAAEAPPDSSAWDKSVRSFQQDSLAMQEFVSDPRTDLFARIPHGKGQTVLREALLVADHNAYHLGQLVMARRLLGAWKAA